MPPCPYENKFSTVMTSSTTSLHSDKPQEKVLRFTQEKKHFAALHSTKTAMEKSHTDWIDVVFVPRVIFMNRYCAHLWVLRLLLRFCRLSLHQPNLAPPRRVKCYQHFPCRVRKSLKKILLFLCFSLACTTIYFMNRYCARKNMKKNFTFFHAFLSLVPRFGTTVYLFCK